MTRHRTTPFLHMMRHRSPHGQRRHNPNRPAQCYSVAAVPHWPILRRPEGRRRAAQPRRRRVALTAAPTFVVAAEATASLELDRPGEQPARGIRPVAETALDRPFREQSRPFVYRLRPPFLAARLE